MTLPEAGIGSPSPSVLHGTGRVSDTMIVFSDSASIEVEEKLQPAIQYQHRAETDSRSGVRFTITPVALRNRHLPSRVIELHPGPARPLHVTSRTSQPARQRYKAIASAMTLSPKCTRTLAGVAGFRQPQHGAVARDELVELVLCHRPASEHGGDRGHACKRADCGLHCARMPRVHSKASVCTDPREMRVCMYVCMYVITYENVLVGCLTKLFFFFFINMLLKKKNMLRG